MRDKEIKDLFGDDFEVSCDFLDHAKLRGDTPHSATQSGDYQEKYTDNASDDYSSIEEKSAEENIGDVAAAEPTKPVYQTQSRSRGHAAPVKQTKIRKTKKKKKRGLPNLGKPLSKTARAAKSGGKTLSRTIGPLLRLISIVLIAWILFLLSSRFWKGYSAFGSLSTILSERNFALAGFLCTGVIILFYGLLSLFWAFTGPKTKEDNRIRKLDTGRGFLFFILVYGGAIISRVAVPLLPSGHNSIEGAKSALSIYSEMTGILFPLCAAGVICCLLRKYIFK